MECHGISLSCVSFCAASHTNALPANVSRMYSSAESLHQTISGLVAPQRTAPREIKLTHTLPTAAGGCFEKPATEGYLVVWRTPAWPEPLDCTVRYDMQRLPHRDGDGQSLLWWHLQSSRRLVYTTAVEIAWKASFVGSFSGLAFNAGLEGISREPLALAAQVDPSNTNGMRTAKVKPKTSCSLRQWFGLTP
jgi:hypothetical protein